MVFRRGFSFTVNERVWTIRGKEKRLNYLDESTLLDHVHDVI